MANPYGGLITEVVYPFGRSALTSTGAQYGSVVSTIATANVFATTEGVTIPLPSNAIAKEIEVGLTMGGYLATSTAAFSIHYQIKDNAQTSYDDLLVSTDLTAVVSTGGLCDVVYAGRKTPSDGTYFTGKGTFDILATHACGSTSKAFAAMKNASYVRYSYYLVG